MGLLLRRTISMCHDFFSKKIIFVERDVRLFCILFCCSSVKPSDMVLVLSFEPIVSASARVAEM